MQEFKRTVTCDRCGKTIKDHFGGYTVKRLANRLYDLCNECYTYVLVDLHSFECELVEETFGNGEGRPCEDGDE